MIYSQHGLSFQGNKPQNSDIQDKLLSIVTTPNGWTVTWDYKPK